MKSSLAIRSATLCSLALFAAACSSSSSSSKPSDDAKSSTTAAATTTSFARPACSPPKADPVVAKRVDANGPDYDVTSFDGTTIRVHWFPRPDGTKSPTVLKGPGWSQPGDVDTVSTGAGLFGDLNIKNLWEAGYNVLTWDPRGFGKSTGTITTNSPDYEGRDVQRLLDWVATQPGVALDAAGDPSTGMVGGSYGGGIQLITAAIDCRVDAIVPTIAWHSLQTSLYKGTIAKAGWGQLLYSLAPADHLDPHITSAYNAMRGDGVIADEDVKWFAARGPADLVAQINVPTLFVQGTVDTLFTLDEAVTNYRILRDKGVPTSMMWYCGGHGICLTDPGDQTRTGAAAVAWLDRYVKGDTSVKLGPRVDIIDQNGARFVADDFPATAGPVVTATGSGTLALTKDSVAGAADTSKAGGVIAGIAGTFTPGKADSAHALEVPVTFDAAALAVGAPKLTVTYKGTSPGEGPTRVFAQVVDSATGIVLGNQITPFEVELDGTAHTTTVDLEMVSFSAKAGAKLTVQLVASTVAYTVPQLGGEVTFSAIKVEMPTTTGFRTA